MKLSKLKLNIIKLNKCRWVALGAMVAGSSASLAKERVIQSTIESSNGTSIDLPSDGSSCDPAVINRNLDRLQSLNILSVDNLTFTSAGSGACYGACPKDLEKALERHCAKAAKLEALVNLWSARE